LAKKFYNLACNISGVFCATKIVLGIMESAMPRKNFEHQIIITALIEQKIRQIRHY
jgi:hypothetical protein